MFSAHFYIMSFDYKRLGIKFIGKSLVLYGIIMSGLLFYFVWTVI